MESLSGIIYVAVCVQSEGSGMPGGEGYRRKLWGFSGLISQPCILPITVIIVTGLQSIEHHFLYCSWYSGLYLNKVSQFQMFRRLVWPAYLSSSCIHRLPKWQYKSRVSQETWSVSPESTGFFNIVKLPSISDNESNKKTGKRNPSHKTEFQSLLTLSSFTIFSSTCRVS